MMTVNLANFLTMNSTMASDIGPSISPDVIEQKYTDEVEITAIDEGDYSRRADNVVLLIFGCILLLYIMAACYRLISDMFKEYWNGIHSATTSEMWRSFTITPHREIFPAILDMPPNHHGNPQDSNFNKIQDNLLAYLEGKDVSRASQSPFASDHGNV